MNPTLNTLKMIEQTIQNHNSKLTKTEVWKKLPKRIMYRTLQSALDYFAEKHYIMYETSGKITWIYYPKLFKRLLKMTVESENRMVTA